MIQWNSRSITIIDTLCINVEIYFDIEIPHITSCLITITNLTSAYLSHALQLNLKNNQKLSIATIGLFGSAAWIESIDCKSCQQGGQRFWPEIPIIIIIIIALSGNEIETKNRFKQQQQQQQQVQQQTAAVTTACCYLPGLFPVCRLLSLLCRRVGHMHFLHMPQILDTSCVQLVVVAAVPVSLHNGLTNLCIVSAAAAAVAAAAPLGEY